MSLWSTTSRAARSSSGSKTKGSFTTSATGDKRFLSAHYLHFSDGDSFVEGHQVHDIEEGKLVTEEVMPNAFAFLFSDELQGEKGERYTRESLSIEQGIYMVPEIFQRRDSGVGENGFVSRQ